MKSRRRKSWGRVDHIKLSDDHRSFAEWLCAIDVRKADWDSFYATIWDFVAHQYGRRSENLCGIGGRESLGGESAEYLQVNQCNKLRKFLLLKNDASFPRHFFRKWFTDQICAAYKKVQKRNTEEMLAIGQKAKDGAKTDGAMLLV